MTIFTAKVFFKTMRIYRHAILAAAYVWIFAYLSNCIFGRRQIAERESSSPYLGEIILGRF